MNQWNFVITEKWDITIVICFITGISVFGTTLRPALAQNVKTNVPKQQTTLALAEDEVKRLMLLMDTDRSGKISLQEFMHFMEAEFDRLGKDKWGTRRQRTGSIADSAQTASGR